MFACLTIGWCLGQPVILWKGTALNVTLYTNAKKTL